MPTTITTSTAATATAYSNQRKIDRCQNGVLLALDNRGSGSDGTGVKYSEDNGATWGPVNYIPHSGTAHNYTGNASLFIDLDDYAHVVYKDHANGYIYYRRGTPNAGRTAWTWSAALLIGAGSVDEDYPDVVAHREGTGWKAHIVFSYQASTTNTARYARVNITSAAAISLDTWTTIGGSYGASVDTWPSIDFNHTGDGKTVAGGTPHLYAAWSAGATGAGKGIRFKKATYSADPTWTWGTEREIDSTIYKNANSEDRWLACLFDGTAVIIAGRLLNAAGTDNVPFAYERNAADSVTTLLFNNGDSTTFYSGQFSYDSSRNLHFVGGSHPGNVYHQEWLRSGGLQTRTLLHTKSDNTFTFASLKRGYSSGRIEFIQVDGTASPYNVLYGSILLNQAPNVPTALTVTSDVLDTTPVFSADISDPDTSQQIKGRFQIYQNDGTTLVGTVDSALRTGAGSVTAEYSSALPVGNYKVQAATVDDAGLISAYTAQVSFSVKQAIEEDINLLWKTDALIVKDISYQWNVLVANQKDISFLWKTFEQTELEFSTLWGIRPPWVPVDPDPDNNPVLWEKVSP